jgi:hypothetical protein
VRAGFPAASPPPRARAALAGLSVVPNLITTFFIRLPVAGVEPAENQAAA